MVPVNTKNVSVVVDRKDFLMNRVVPGILIVIGGAMTVWAFIQSIGVSRILSKLGL